jgi:CRISPR-associated endonuclease/helicase Cas3
VDIPTGLGKTAVMALWLIARAGGAQLPRRLVYVVDRRAVVDQATEFAVLLRENLDSPAAADLKKALELGDRSLPISTLRGQHVDNREWLEDPASTAIVVGTVDMIGSRLLFAGYGVSRKMRPLSCRAPRCRHGRGIGRSPSRSAVREAAGSDRTGLGALRRAREGR